MVIKLEFIGDEGFDEISGTSKFVVLRIQNQHKGIRR
jgi:hypothetical protein